MLFRFAGVFVLLALNLAKGQPCDPVDIRVYQENTLLTTANPIVTNQNVSEFYDYRGGYHVAGSYNGNVLPTEGTTSLLAIHQDSNDCKLSFVAVHSKQNEGPDYGAFWMYINGDVTTAVVKDDGEFDQFMLHDDQYDDLYQRRLGRQLIQFHWFKEDTDGVAQHIVDNWEGCIQIEARFIVTSLNSRRRRERRLAPDFGEERSLVPDFSTKPFWYGFLDQWKFVSADGSTTDLERDESKTVSICFGSGTPSNPGSDPFPRDSSEQGNCDQLGDTTFPLCGYCERNICHWHTYCNVVRKIYCKTGIPIPP